MLDIQSDARRSATAHVVSLTQTTGASIALAACRGRMPDLSGAKKAKQQTKQAN